ncbi:MAG TPA: hypothetical protein VFU86_22195 [Terriglobales bacterium]|nr:hypothetical protein [Terriglobales bacterium]
MRRLAALALSLFFAFTVFGQQSELKPSSEDSKPVMKEVQPSVPDAKPADVASVNSILAALYDVISGPPGPRDWDRFNSLFIPEAHLIFTGKKPDGTPVHRALTPKEYQEHSGAFFLKEGFFEKSIGNKIDRFGQVAQVFSAYESRHQKGDKPFARGINSIQLMNDGKRWWVVSILWDSERPDNPIPKRYLMSK